MSETNELRRINEAHSRRMDDARRRRTSCLILSKGEHCSCELCDIDMLTFKAKQSLELDALRAEVAKLTAERDALRELVTTTPLIVEMCVKIYSDCDEHGELQAWLARRSELLKGTDHAPSVEKT